MPPPPHEPGHSNDCEHLPKKIIAPRYNSTTHDRLQVSENRYRCEIFKYYKSNGVQQAERQLTVNINFIGGSQMKCNKNKT